jgi:hypothetical protein
MKTIILNSSNIVPDGTNSKFQYFFPQGGYTFKDDLIAVNSISQYFSSFNISSTYNNNSFSYIWVDGGEYQVSIPNGYYSVAQINAFLHSVQYANKHYLLTSAGQIVYLLELVINQSRYAVSLNTYLISVAIATTNSWTLPVGAGWVLPNNDILPYLVVPATNNFGKLIGFASGQYPAGVIDITIPPPDQTQIPSFAESQSILSTFAPQITPYSSFLVYCSLVNNRSVIPSQLIYSYTPTGATFGALQEYAPQSELAWNAVQDGQYTQFLVEFKDQLGNPITFQDPNTLITLITKNKAEFG